MGPNWHATKAGTPPWAASPSSAPAAVSGVRHPAYEAGRFSALYVLVLSLCFGLIGFLDDLFKVRFHRNLGLTAIQKAMLQLAVSALFLYILFRAGF